MDRRVFVFGSEIKALARHPAWTGEIDRDALALFMRHNNVPRAVFDLSRNPQAPARFLSDV